VKEALRGPCCDGALLASRVACAKGGLCQAGDRLVVLYPTEWGSSKGAGDQGGSRARG
jgi:hypothetical protein